jgi:hypothetical protein
MLSSVVRILLRSSASLAKTSKVDVPFQYLTFIREDDEALEKIRSVYEGNILVQPHLAAQSSFGIAIAGAVRILFVNKTKTRTTALPEQLRFQRAMEISRPRRLFTAGSQWSRATFDTCADPAPNDYHHSYLYVGFPVGLRACYSPLITVEPPSRPRSLLPIKKALFSIRPGDHPFKGGANLSMTQKLEEFLLSEVGYGQELVKAMD